jgi:hypothetical protein
VFPAVVPRTTYRKFPVTYSHRPVADLQNQPLISGPAQIVGERVLSFIPLLILHSFTHRHGIWSEVALRSFVSPLCSRLLICHTPHPHLSPRPPVLRDVRVLSGTETHVLCENTVRSTYRDARASCWLLPCARGAARGVFGASIPRQHLC